jgi:hypothetical protein
MWSIGLNAVLGFLMAVTLIFTMGDVNSILDTPTGQPFMQVFFNATQSYAATNVMCAIVIIILCSCCISEVATASRQIWSFARDGGLPASAWLSKVIFAASYRFHSLIYSADQPSTEPPCSCRHGHVPHHESSLLHQSWVLGNVERHQLSWWCIASHLIFNHDQLFCLAPFPRSTAAAPMGSGQIWYGNQHRSASVSTARGSFRVLAFDDASHCFDDELGICHVCRSHGCGSHSLHHMGQEQLRGSSHEGQKKLIRREWEEVSNLHQELLLRKSRHEKKTNVVSSVTFFSAPFSGL